MYSLPFKKLNMVNVNLLSLGPNIPEGPHALPGSRVPTCLGGGPQKVERPSWCWW